MKPQDIEHIFERLREGMVPERGLEAFAVGIDTPMNELRRQLKMTRQGEGASKFLRGDYGCGKTFISQLTLLEALQQNFAVSKVVVSPNDTPFYKFDEVYARIAGGLQTRMARGGALADCIDRWIAAVEEALIGEGQDEDAPDFDDKVQQRFESELSELGKEEAGSDFIAVLRHYFRLKQSEQLPEAMQLLSWLAGSKNISATIKRAAGIKGEISSQTALTYLKGLLSLIKRAGYAGLVVAVDEMETVLRMRTDIREKSLNGIRQILDASPEFKGLFWLFTGTPEFYDSRKGVAGLAPLHDRITFRSSGGFVNVRQPQLELTPFDNQRLREVALRLREIYPGADRSRLHQLIDESFIQKLAAQVSSGFGGDVGVIPRQFLREFVDVMDLVDQHPDYIPAEVYAFAPRELSAEEAFRLHGQAPETVEAIEF
ncbi:MAG: BREX system ATP-binding protein BrxD [Candidatus Melainabacteria bacterium HGW-Melainabacteria-1]|nr:MAG: BREX system ATP-binding protein BrxD [Candidatus Melainabacteria bacterium HGW-Melainabacteria-1]